MAFGKECCDFSDLVASRLDEETKKRMEYEVKLNAFEEERRQILEEAGEGFLIAVH